MELLIDYLKLLVTSIISLVVSSPGNTVDGTVSIIGTLIIWSPIIILYYLIKYLRKRK